MNRIDVILPVYNAETTLNECLESLLNQTFRDFRVIAVDDGSTDNSFQILKKYAELDSRIFLIQQTNLGLVKTLNKAIAVSDAEYIARHDADDFSEPERFEKQIDYLDKNPKVVVLGTAIQTINAESKVTSIYSLPTDHKSIIYSFLRENAIAHGSVMLRAKCIKKLSGYSYTPEVEHVEDFDLWQRAATIGTLHNLPEALYFYRDHSGNVSNRHSELQSIRASLLSQTFVNNGNFNSAKLQGGSLIASLKWAISLRSGHRDARVHYAYRFAKVSTTLAEHHDWRGFVETSLIAATISLSTLVGLYFARLNKFLRRSND